MPFVDAVVSEHYFQSDLTNILIDGQWIKYAVFNRVAYTLDAEKPMLCCAQHYILKSPKGDLFGIAITSDEFEGTTVDILTQGMDRLNSDRRLPQVYFYTLDKFDSSDIKNHSIGTNDTTLRKALDVEYVTTNKPETQQSPVVIMKLRALGEQEKLFGDDQIFSNWWEDSLIRVKGFFDSRSLFFTIQSDNAASFTNNEVPKIPLFFGRFDSFKDDNGDNVALFGGSYGDFNSDGYESLLPIKKTYYTNPGNGVSNIIVKKTKYGARYQAHYLSWETVPNLMEPLVNNYPRSLDPSISQFNPSRYDNSVQASLAYIVHPEQGVYGTLPNIVLVDQLSILDGDILEVETPKCEGQLDEYIFTLIDSPSPFTIAGKPIQRPAGVGVRIS